VQVETELKVSSRALQSTQSEDSCGPQHDSSKCRRNSDWDAQCCAAPGDGSCGEGFEFREGSGCYLDLLQTCCLPTLVQSAATLVTFATKGENGELRFAAIQFLDGIFTIASSAAKEFKQIRPQTISPIGGEQVHLVLTYASNGRIQLFREGEMVENLRTNGAGPGVNAHTSHAAVLIGSGPNSLELAAGTESDEGMETHFDGGFLETRFFPVAMSAKELAEAYKTQKRIRQDAKVVRWD